MYEDDEYTILITPESGKVYLDIPSSNSYRWSGSTYVLIGGGGGSGYCNTSYFTCSGTTGGGGSIFKVSW